MVTSKFIGERIIITRRINSGHAHSEFNKGDIAIITGTDLTSYYIQALNDNRKSGGCKHGMHFEFENQTIEILYGST